MKEKPFPYVLLFLAGIICLNLWNKNRRLKLDLQVAEAKLNFTQGGKNAYDSVYAKRTSKGSTVSFYKNGVLLGSTVTVEE